MGELFNEALDWLEIPSISAGERDEDALRDAAAWATKRVRGAGGTCRDGRTRRAARRWSSGNCVRQARTRPMVMIYGHCDVQDPGDPG